MEETPFLALKAMRRDFDFRARKHSVYSLIYNLSHVFLGYPQVITTVIITSVTGMTNPDWIFFLSVLNSVLSVSIVFFKISQRASLHSTSKNQWIDLSLDVQQALVEKDQETMQQFEISVLEREKFIKSYEPQFCLDCCVKIQEDPIHS